MGIHGNHTRNVWNNTSEHSWEQFIRTTPRQPRVLPSKHTPGLWQHVWRTISFKFVVVDFGIGYVGREHVYHQMSALKMYNEKLQQIGKEHYTVV